MEHWEAGMRRKLKFRKRRMKDSQSLRWRCKKKGDCYPNETKEIVSKWERFPSHSLRPEWEEEVTAAVRKIKNYLEKKEGRWLVSAQKLKPNLLHSSGQVSGDSPGAPHSQSPLRNLCDSKEADPAFFFFFSKRYRPWCSINRQISIYYTNHLPTVTG